MGRGEGHPEEGAWGAGLRGAEGILVQWGLSEGISVEAHAAPGQPRGWGAGADWACGTKPEPGDRAAHRRTACHGVSEPR